MYYQYFPLINIQRHAVVRFLHNKSTIAPTTGKSVDEIKPLKKRVIYSDHTFKLQ